MKTVYSVDVNHGAGRLPPEFGVGDGTLMEIPPLYIVMLQNFKYQIACSTMQ